MAEWIHRAYQRNPRQVFNNSLYAPLYSISPLQPTVPLMGKLALTNLRATSPLLHDVSRSRARAGKTNTTRPGIGPLHPAEQLIPRSSRVGGRKLHSRYGNSPAGHEPVVVASADACGPGDGAGFSWACGKAGRARASASKRPISFFIVVLRRNDLICGA